MYITQPELAQQLRLRFKNEFRCPAVCIFRVLWRGEAINVRTVSRDQHEIKEVPLDQASFVLCPERPFVATESQRFPERRREIRKETALAWISRHSPKLPRSRVV